MKKTFCSAIIVAAGSGTRIKSNIKKQFILIKDKPILFYSLLAFENCSYIDEIILVLSKDYIEFFEYEIKNKYFFKKVKVVSGGLERQDSVLNGLQQTDKNSEIILVHDGVRPFVNEKNITDIINKTIETGAAILAVKVKDTVKIVENGIVTSTPDRATLYNVQTPQGFKKEILLNAFANRKDGIIVTDESKLVEMYGNKVSVVEGSYENIKITTKEDLLFANGILQTKV